MGIVAAENPRMTNLANMPQAVGQVNRPANFQETVNQNRNLATDLRSSSPETQAKTEDKNNSKEGASIWERSFFMGVVQDIIKTMSKVLFGSMPVNIVNGALKDSSFSLDKIAYNEFVTAFPSKFLADASGAVSIRLFNGKTKLFGFIPMPYIPASIASQIFSNPIVKLWRSLSSNYNLNKQSAEKDKSEAAEQIRKEISETSWFQMLERFRKTFEEKIKPKLDFFLSRLFGVMPGQVAKDKSGKVILDDKGKAVKTDPKVNWFHAGAVSLGSFVATAMMPRHTQVYGFDDINKSKGLAKVFRTIFAVGIQSLSRLETNLFKNAVGMHTEGYSFDACMKTSIREKQLTPMVQYTVDAISALLSKVVPMNGATISILMRLPFEIIATFMSSGLVGVSKENRMPDNWKYLGDKLWKPVAKVVEKVCIPLYKYTVKPFYSFLFKFFNSKFDGMYREHESDPLPKEIEEKFNKQGVMSVFMDACNPFNLYRDVKNLVSSSKRKEDSEIEAEMTGKAPKGSADKETDKKTNESKKLESEVDYGYDD